MKYAQKLKLVDGIKKQIKIQKQVKIPKKKY